MALIEAFRAKKKSYSRLFYNKKNMNSIVCTFSKPAERTIWELKIRVISH